MELTGADCVCETRLETDGTKGKCRWRLFLLPQPSRSPPVGRICRSPGEEACREQLLRIVTKAAFRRISLRERGSQLKALGGSEYERNGSSPDSPRLSQLFYLTPLSNQPTSQCSPMKMSHTPA